MMIRANIRHIAKRHHLIALLRLRVWWYGVKHEQKAFLLLPRTLEIAKRFGRERNPMRFSAREGEI